MTFVYNVEYSAADICSEKISDGRDVCIYGARGSHSIYARREQRRELAEYSNCVVQVLGVPSCSLIYSCACSSGHCQ